MWWLWLGQDRTSVKVLFLGCVLVAGVFGGLTAARKIRWIQTLPAAIGLLLVLALRWRRHDRACRRRARLLVH